MKLNLKRGAALVLSASMTLQAPVPAFAKVAGHSANPAAYSTSASSEAQLTAPEGTDSQSSAAAATSAPAATSTGTGGAETSAPASTETAAQTSDGQPEIGGQATSLDETPNAAQSQNPSPASDATNPDAKFPSSTAQYTATYTATEKSVNSDYSLPGSAEFAGNPGRDDLSSIFENAGFEALGTGNTPADPVLNQVQIATYQMRDAAGNVIGDTATNNPGKGLFSANGFSKFYMIHSGIARMYYRVYTDQHGWSPWAASKEITPYNEDGAKVQAIQIRVKGMAHRYNDVYYKVMLNDGTVLDWAKNGQTTGTMGSDRYIVGIRVGFWHNTEHFPYASKNLMVGKYEGAYRDGTGVHYSSHSGTPYTGWGFLDNVQHYFIDGEPARGWHYVDGYKYYFNNDGSVVTDLETIMGPQASYQINYNQGTRTMYIMAKDGDNGYIIPYKTFNSTSGPDTPMGNYKIYAKYDVKYMHDDVPAAIYCKYLNRFYNGFIIHSILYYSAKLELDAITFNYIDDAASGGCLRLLTGYSYWVYKNCGNGTVVHIYNDPWNKGPVEKDAIEVPIPRDQKWDPTDPSSGEAAAALQAAAQLEQQKAAAVAAGQVKLTAEEQQLADELKKN